MKRFICIFLSATNLVYSAFAGQANLTPGARTYKSPSLILPVIYLKDVHESPEAQLQQAEILRNLIKENSDKKIKICVEGAWGDIPTDWLSSFPDREVKEDVSYALLRQGVLNGEEYITLINESGRISLVGIDSPVQYKENLMAKEKVLRGQKLALEYISHTKGILLSRTDKFGYTALAEFIRTKEKLEAGTIGLRSYAGFLFSKDSRLQAANYKNLSRLLQINYDQKEINRIKSGVIVNQ